MNKKIEWFILNLLASVSGYSIMSIELLASRVLSPFVGDNIYSWGSILTAFLTSLAIGYLFGGYFCDKLFKKHHLGFTFFLFGAFLIPSIVFSSEIFDLIASYINDVRYQALLLVFILFSMPLIFAGSISPMQLKIAVTDLGDIGKNSGQLHFIAAIGSGIGAISISFYLVSIFGVHLLLLFFTSLLCLIGLIVSHLFHHE